MRLVNFLIGLAFVGGPCRARTYDPLVKSSTLTLSFLFIINYLQRLPLSKIRENHRKSGIVTMFTSQLRHTEKSSFAVVIVSTESK